MRGLHGGLGAATVWSWCNHRMALAAGAEAILVGGRYQLSVGGIAHRPCFACRGRKLVQAAIALMLHDPVACEGQASRGACRLSRLPQATDRAAQTGDGRAADGGSP